MTGDFLVIKSSASGFDVLPHKNATPVYHINRPGSGVLLYRGSSKRGSLLAQAKMKLGSSREMAIHIGSLKDPSAEEWDSVHHSKEGHGFLKRTTETWRFEVREPASATSSDTCPREMSRKLAWHTAHGNFVLRDEQTDVVLADHTDKSILGDCGYGSTLGSTKWQEACAEEIVIAAFVTLMAILERRRGGARQVGRAIGSQVGNGFGPTTVAL